MSYTVGTNQTKKKMKKHTKKKCALTNRTIIIRNKPKNNYYAVAYGRESNVIVKTWAECFQLVNKFSGAIYAGFVKLEDAQNFLLLNYKKSEELSNKNEFI